MLSVIRFIATHPLARTDKVGATLRFVRWQIRSRLASRPLVHPWIGGSKFLARSGETGLTGNIYAGLHEFADMGYLLHVLRAQDLFVDIGANVGSYTILACRAIGARGYAIEPVPETFRRLLSNVRLNGIDERVMCLNVGASSESGFLHFKTGLDTTNHAMADGDQAAGTIRVAVSTLDEVLRRESPALIKIDVEGYETPVLQGASETLRNPALHSVILELNGSGRHYGFSEQKILATLFDRGFKSYTYDLFTRCLIDLQGTSLREGNTLFIRNESLVRERLAGAEKFIVHGRAF